jgi:hypothetical protein
MHVQLVWQSDNFTASSIPPYRILEKQGPSDHRCTEAEKLDSSAMSFAFQGFWAFHARFFGYPFWNCPALEHSVFFEPEIKVMGSRVVFLYDKPGGTHCPCKLPLQPGSLKFQRLSAVDQVIRTEASDIRSVGSIVSLGFISIFERISFRSLSGNLILPESLKSKAGCI